MNSYLNIAEEVLRAERRPLTARSILKAAYVSGAVPAHLFGKTQHKTLQARLSEDILHHRERSRFFRTEPGRFFLREFLVDGSLPTAYRKEMIARRRTRDLLRGPALGVDRNCLRSEMARNMGAAAKEVLSRVREQGCYKYVEPRRVSDGVALVWAVATVRRNNQVLTYRTGRYRDDRDSFAQKRSLCFAALVVEDDQSLFDYMGFGIAQCGLTAVSTDLNISIDGHYDPSALSTEFTHDLACLLWRGDDEKSELLAVVEINAPSWFEPVQQGRLSINDLRWMGLEAPPNNVDDFDPWSQTILANYFDCESCGEPKQKKSNHSSP